MKILNEIPYDPQREALQRCDICDTSE